MEIHSLYMKRALELAKLGAGKVAPNPMVGAVIVNKGNIIGEGYHQFHGGPHAEVNAINEVKNEELLNDSRLYVTLEPCNHTGLTPPCTSLILEKSIPEIIIAQTDPNPLVSGTGIDRLRKNGAKVLTGILEEESREMNRRFNTFHEKKRPFIILKWAQSSDGFIDKIRKKDDPIQANWITDEFCRRMVHKWRSEEAAIMVGTETALKDNPKLNVRSWEGDNPIRVVLDRHIRLPASLNLLDSSIPTLVYTANQKSGKKNIEYIRLDFDDDILVQVLNSLYQKGIQSVFVEGGRQLLTSFINQNLWDEARIFTGSMKFKDGIKAPDFPFKPKEKHKTGNSILEITRNQ